jgi:hypothetical protein
LTWLSAIAKKAHLQKAAELIRQHPRLSLLCDPELSVVAFTRDGWTADEYQQWADQLLADQIGSSRHRPTTANRYSDLRL